MQDQLGNEASLFGVLAEKLRADISSVCAEGSGGIGSRSVVWCVLMGAESEGRAVKIRIQSAERRVSLRLDLITLIVDDKGAVRERRNIEIRDRYTGR